MSNNTMNTKNQNVRFTVVKKLGVIKEYPDKWCKAANIIKWNDDEPKINIRDWKFDGEGNTMTRGITLTSREAIELAGNLLVWATKLDEVNEKGGE